MRGLRAALGRRLRRKRVKDMCVFSLFRNNSDIKTVTKNVIRKINAIAKSTVKEKYWITHYGANDIHPKYLVIWICVKTDVEKNRLNNDTNLMESMRNVLNEVNYPEEGRTGVHIGFESRETVDRDSDGNWYFHWK